MHSKVKNNKCPQCWYLLSESGNLSRHIKCAKLYIIVDKRAKIKRRKQYFMIPEKSRKIPKQSRENPIPTDPVPKPRFWIHLVPIPTEVKMSIPQGSSAFVISNHVATESQNHKSRDNKCSQHLLSLLLSLTERQNNLLVNLWCRILLLIF
jgi:uncharacterized C2H2 Zn-finger protein